jgi:hypothetical protein
MFVTVEGNLDAVVVRRLVSESGIALTRLDTEGGRDTIQRRIPKILEAAQRETWMVLIDLDADPCPGDLRLNWGIPDRSPLLFRVAVRSVEAWLMADRQRFSEFLSVSIDRITHEPENLPNAKAELISLARYSRSRDLRDAIIPRQGSGRKQGPLYTEVLSTYVVDVWRPEVARNIAPSLGRCLKRLQFGLGAP